MAILAIRNQRQSTFAINGRRFLRNIARVVLCTLLAFVPVLVHAKEPMRVINGIVTKISDGDTVQVTDPLGTKVKIRLYGIDAPETEKVNRKTGRISKPGQPYGEEAQSALKAKIDHQQVRVEVMAIDRYKRSASILWLGNRNINEEMVREGWAWAYRQYLDRAYASEYIQAEEQARREKRGLWQQSNPQAPWHFRQSLRKGSRTYGLLP